MPRKASVKTTGKIPLGKTITDVKDVVKQYTANPEAPAIYASSVAILASPVDLVLIIGQLDTSPEGPNLKKAATIFFSPAHAKQFAIILAQKVAEYEAQFGEIAPGFFGAMQQQQA